VTYKVTSRQISAAADEGEKQRTHESDLAARDRSFQRRADACTFVAKHLNWCMAYAEWRKQTLTAWLGDSKPVVPQRPADLDGESRDTAEAMARLFLPETVTAQLHLVNVQVTTMDLAVEQFRSAEHGNVSLEAHKVAMAECSQVLESASVLLRQMNADLADG